MQNNITNIKMQLNDVRDNISKSITIAVALKSSITDKIFKLLQGINEQFYFLPGKMHSALKRM